MALAFVEVLNGPYTAVCMALDAGATATVGRSGKCTVSLPDDALLQPRQFSISNAGPYVLISNLRPDVPLECDGARVQSLVVQKPTRLRCGRSEFLVSCGDHSLDRESTPLGTLAKSLCSSGNSLTLLFSESPGVNVRRELKALGMDPVAVFEGPTQDSLEGVAPYLAEVPQRKVETVLYLLRLLWGRSRAIWIGGGGPVSEIRLAFRKLAIVDDGEEPVNLRFYDPRVLHAFLLGCNEQEKQQCFGLFHSITVESRKPAKAHHWRFGPGGAGPLTLDFENRWNVNLMNDLVQYLVTSRLVGPSGKRHV